MFQQFDEDAQQQIKISLNRLVNILQEAYNILRGRYGSFDISTTLSSESLLSGKGIRTTSLDDNKAPIRRARSPLLMIKWSFRDKKRVEAILFDFARLNGQIHEYIKFICLGTSIGVGLNHLEHLQDDENSIGLGFDVDAKLKLSVQREEGLPESFELPNPWAPQILELPTQERFAIFRYGGASYLMESRPYEGAGSFQSELGSLSKHRTDALARLLQQPKEQVFRIPRCIGWRYMQRQSSIAFVFENPTPQCHKSVSLNELLRSDHEKPSLNSKFNVAHGLAKGIAQLHLVRWVSATTFSLSCHSEYLLLLSRTSSTPIIRRYRKTLLDIPLNNSRACMHMFNQHIQFFGFTALHIS